ncbi:CoA-binding protein [Polaromonas sp. P1-6]|nr:CoA-binding protein [Polaromonas sp. P1-6]
MSSLSCLLEPTSIALIGASPDAGKLAARPLAYLKKYGFQGPVYAVNPKYGHIDGVPCVPTVADLPRGIDLALILLPAHGVADALEQCALQGVRCAISIAGGFAEAGAGDEQDKLTAICQRHGIRLVGPNCVGVLHPALGVTATFSSEAAQCHAPAGQGRALHPVGRAGQFAAAKLQRPGHWPGLLGIHGKRG